MLFWFLVMMMMVDIYRRTEGNPSISKMRALKNENDGNFTLNTYCRWGWSTPLARYVFISFRIVEFGFDSMMMMMMMMIMLDINTLLFMVWYITFLFVATISVLFGSTSHHTYRTDLRRFWRPNFENEHRRSIWTVMIQRRESHWLVDSKDRKNDKTRGYMNNTRMPPVTN